MPPKRHYTSSTHVGRGTGGPREVLSDAQTPAPSRKKVRRLSLVLPLNCIMGYRWLPKEYIAIVVRNTKSSKGIYRKMHLIRNYADQRFDPVFHVMCSGWQSQI
jgi:hypothetical protein